MSMLTVLARTEDLSLANYQQIGSGDLIFRVEVSVMFDLGNPCTGLRIGNFHIWHLDVMQSIKLQSVWEVGQTGEPGASGFYELQFKRSIGDNVFLAPIARHYGLVVSSSRGDDKNVYRGQTFFTLSYEPQ